jgi:altronate dehydratase small subunit
MAGAFQIHPSDNVATLIADAAEGDAVALMGGKGTVRAAEAITAGHKMAIVPIASGAAVTKFGVRIGHATRDIAPGEWVHLHNLASDHDERSGSLDQETGAPTDTPYL